MLCCSGHSLLVKNHLKEVTHLIHLFTHSLIHSSTYAMYIQELTGLEQLVNYLQRAHTLGRQDPEQTTVRRTVREARQNGEQWRGSAISSWKELWEEANVGWWPSSLHVSSGFEEGSGKGAFLAGGTVRMMRDGKEGRASAV